MHDGELRIGWGPFRPQVMMEARIKVTCTPMPDCSKWGTRLYVSTTLIDRAASTWLTLTDGWSRTIDVADQDDRRWVYFTVAVSRIDD